MDEAKTTSQFENIISSVLSDIASIRTGRATPSLVENIIVPAYGGTQRLKVVELASISVPDSSSLVISPWDKSIIGDIKKGILEANIGLTPNVDGEIIRISIPPMTTEDRERYVKLLSQKMETGRVMIRQVRGDVMHDIKKDFEEKKITEDEKFAFEKKLQELTDKYIGVIEEKGEAKKVEITTL